jgi:hypothetical protein
MPGNDDLTLLVKRAEALSGLPQDRRRREPAAGLQARQQHPDPGRGEGRRRILLRPRPQVRRNPEERALFAALDAAEAAIAPAMAGRGFRRRHAPPWPPCARPSTPSSRPCRSTPTTRSIRRNRLNLLHRIRAICLSGRRPDPDRGLTAAIFCPATRHFPDRRGGCEIPRPAGGLRSRRARARAAGVGCGRRRACACAAHRAYAAQPKERRSAATRPMPADSPRSRRRRRSRRHPWLAGQMPAAAGPAGPAGAAHRGAVLRRGARHRRGQRCPILRGAPGAFGDGQLVSVRPSSENPDWGGPGTILNIGMNDARHAALAAQARREAATALYLRSCRPMPHPCRAAGPRHVRARADPATRRCARAARL